MARFSPKIEIINHFDNLINRVDIDIDICLEKWNNKQILGELLNSSKYKRKKYSDLDDYLRVDFCQIFNSSKQFQSLDLWPESIKVIDYLKQVRMKTIEELRKAQEDTLEYYKLNSSELSDEKNTEKLRSDLFADNYYFQISFKQPERIWAFNVFTFITDFYISPSDIDLLQKLINNEKQPFGRDFIFDEKTVLIGLLYKYFLVNLLNFPNHVIRVCKEDVLNIKKMIFYHESIGFHFTSSSTIDLSKLAYLYLDSRNQRESVKFNIEGLSSLKVLALTSKSTDTSFSIRNLNSLISLYLDISTIDDKILTVLEQVQHIEQLNLYGNISYLNLDFLSNLKMLRLIGTITESFNIEIFKNLSYQLEGLNIMLKNVDEKTFFKLFDGYNFPNIQNLTLSDFNFKQFKKEFINPFPMLRQLFLLECNIKEIEKDAFETSNLKHLTLLDLSGNWLKFIEKNTFSNLKNLEILDLSDNVIEHVDSEFIGVRNSVKIFLDKVANYTFRYYWHRNYF